MLFVPEFIFFMGGRVPFSLLPFFSVVFYPYLISRFRSHVVIFSLTFHFSFSLFRTSSPPKKFSSCILHFYLPLYSSFADHLSFIRTDTADSAKLTTSPTDRPLRPTFGNTHSALHVGKGGEIREFRVCRLGRCGDAGTLFLTDSSCT